MRAFTWAVTLLVGAMLPAQAQQPGPAGPQAGSWKTWVIASGHEFRVSRSPSISRTA